MKKYIVLSVLILFFIGCASSSGPKKLRQKQINKKVEREIKKEESGDYVKWWDREKPIPLKIVAVAYTDEEIKETDDYRMLKGVVESFNELIRGRDVEDEIKDRFSSIEVIDFDSSEEYRNKFNAALEYKLSDKDSLIAALKPSLNSAELLIAIDYNELKKGNLVVEGYKSINIDEKRNGYFYTLKKYNYSNLTETGKKRAMYNAVVALLELSIPSYIAIDTDKLAQKGKLKVLNQYADDKYELSIYEPKHSYNKTKQILYVSPLTSNDILVLHKSGYISFDDDTLTTSQIRELMGVLNRKFLADDEVLMASYPDVVMKHSGTNIEYIENTLVTYKETKYDIEDILSTSVLSEDEKMFWKIYSNKNFIEDDIDTGFVFKLASYLAKNPYTSFNNVYIEVKDDRVLRIFDGYVTSSDVLKRLRKNGIDTFLYQNGRFRNIYNKNVGKCMKFLFYPVEDDVCNSKFYGFCYGIGCLFADTVALASVVGIGSHAVIYKDSYLDEYRKSVGVRNFTLFKSQL